MSALQLHPFAAQIEWDFDQALAANELEDLFRKYFETLAQECILQGKTIIGHIKGFTKLPENGFIQISAVSASQPASIAMKDGSYSKYECLSMTLNFLVYGLPFSAAAQIAQESAIDLMDKVGGRVIFSKVSDPKQPGH